MKVSVIVPVHAGQIYLPDCLESLVEQKFDGLEVIVICDHIDFDIEEKLEGYRDRLNFRVYELENGRGVAAARNLGMEKAEGEYIFFLDSDDYLAGEVLLSLTELADENDADLVCCKKRTSWYKKAFFLENLAQEQDAKEDESEQDSESVGLKAEELEDEESDLTPEEAKLAMVRRELVSKRRGIKNISVHGMLIRRELLKDQQIRFNEDLIYHADVPFVMQVLFRAKRCDGNLGVFYVQRKHNDPDYFPSLSQIKDEGRFDEFLKTFHMVKVIVKKDEDLGHRLDRKLVNYYCGYYMTRMRRSENPIWCEERFLKMQEAMKTIDPEVVQELKGYKRRAVNALLNGQVWKSKMLINVRLGVKKIKVFFAHPREIFKYMYRHFFVKKPVLEDVVLCESFFGKNYSDSPKYIYEYISKNYPGKYRFVWVIDKKNTKIPYKHKKVKRFSLRYAYYLARAKYFVFNGRQPAWTQKREGTVFLETWHGTPLKKLVFDQDDVCSATPLYKHQVYVQSRQWDYLVAANEFSSNVFRSCFRYDKEMLEYGYPRNDLLHAPNRDELAAALRKKLGIPEGKKTILYAPTWRDDEYYDKGQYKFALKFDLHQLREQLGEEYVLLLRTHYFIADALDVTGLEDFAFNLSKYDDITELYLISDILITDYSSVFFDYANLKRPILFYTYDLEKYRDVLRGFYISIEDEVPGPLVFNQEEIVEGIRNIDAITEEYKEKYDRFYERFCAWEDGHAAENCAKAVFDLD